MVDIEKAVREADEATELFTVVETEDIVTVEPEEWLIIHSDGTYHYVIDGADS